MRRIVLRTTILAAALVGTLVGACVTPSIPIPPPDPEDMNFTISTPPDGSSTAVLTYPPDRNYEGGTAYLFNHDTGSGVFHVVNPDFSVGPLALEATVGNQVVFTIESTDQTVSRCVVLREGAQDPNTYCSF